MSFSFPSSSGWEPASQRTLGWRGTASRHAAAPVASVPRAERWARLRPSQPSLPPPPPQPASSSTPAGSGSTPPLPASNEPDTTSAALAAAQFAAGERDARVLAEVERSTSVARAARTGVEEVMALLRSQTAAAERNTKTLSNEVSKARRAVHAVDARREVAKAAGETHEILRETLRSFAVAHERSLERVVGRVTEGALRGVRGMVEKKTKAIRGEVVAIGAQVETMRGGIDDLSEEVKVLCGEMRGISASVGRLQGFLERVESALVKRMSMELVTGSTGDADAPPVGRVSDQAPAGKKPLPIPRSGPNRIRKPPVRTPTTRPRASVGGKRPLVRPPRVWRGIAKPRSRAGRVKCDLSPARRPTGSTAGVTPQAVEDAGLTDESTDSADSIGSDASKPASDSTGEAQDATEVKQDAEIDDERARSGADSLFDESIDHAKREPEELREAEENVVPVGSTLAPWMFEDEATQEPQGAAEVEAVPMTVRVRLSGSAGARVRTRSMTRRRS